MRFSSIESIVVGYRYHRIRQGIDTIKLLSILLPSLARDEGDRRDGHKNSVTPRRSAAWSAGQGIPDPDLATADRKALRANPKPGCRLLHFCDQ